MINVWDQFKNLKPSLACHLLQALSVIQTSKFTGNFSLNSHPLTLYFSLCAVSFFLKGHMEKKCQTDSYGYIRIESATVAANFLLNLTKCQQHACLRFLQNKVTLWWLKIIGRCWSLWLDRDSDCINLNNQRMETYAFNTWPIHADGLL